MEVPPWDQNRQHLLNRWAVPSRFTPCPYPPGPIPVVARLRWSVDGEELHDGRATAWTERLVLVELVDRRLGVNGVWLDLNDVRRR